MVSDGELLRHYVEQSSQTAFTALVQRHFQVVRRAAQRRVRSPHLADDITQRVFTDLARKAPKLTERENVIGWLYTSVRFAAGDAVRAEQRRQARETIALMMQETSTAPETTPETAWSRLEPWLDEALEELSESDREALLLHFFENRTFVEVGAALATSADAARMRVNRALEKLRDLLRRRGITSTAAALGEALLTQAASAAESSQAAQVAQEAMRLGALPASGGLALLAKVVLSLGILGAGGMVAFHASRTVTPAIAVAKPTAPVETVGEAKEPVQVTEEAAVNESEPEPVAPGPANPVGSVPAFANLTAAEKRILKVLWSREQEFGSTPGRAWVTSVAPGRPRYADFVAAQQELRSRGWVRVVGAVQGAALTEAGLAYCITQRDALEAFPMPKTKPRPRAEDSGDR